MKINQTIEVVLRRSIRNTGFDPYNTGKSFGKALERSLGRRLERLDIKSEHTANRLLARQA